jgi:hypothetical protein
MTDVWWMLEQEIANKRHEYQGKILTEVATGFFTILNKSIISILGLNLIPVEEPDGTFREPNDTEIIPFVMAVGHPEFLSDAMDKIEKFQHQKKALEDKPLDSDVEEDLLFLDELDEALGHTGKSDKDIIWESEEVQKTLEQVLTKGEPPPPDEALAEDMPTSKRKKRRKRTVENLPPVELHRPRITVTVEDD